MPATFTDNTGHLWAVTLDDAALDRIREATGWDMRHDLATGNTSPPSTNPLWLIAAIYAVCEPEADRLGIAPGEFGRRIAGASFNPAWRALQRAAVDLYPADVRPMLHQAIAFLERKSHA